jgi:hypothetical protein
MHRCENMPAGTYEEGGVERAGLSGNINTGPQRPGIKDLLDPLTDPSPLARQHSILLSIYTNQHHPSYLASPGKFDIRPTDQNCSWNW